MSERFENYLKEIPQLHTWDGGKTFNSGGFTSCQLRYIHDFIKKNIATPRILETGAGNSTLCFLFTEPEILTTICPRNGQEFLWAGLFKNINKFNLNKNKLNLIQERSEKALPEGVYGKSLKNNYNFVLIDGNHALNPVIDFYYSNMLLEKGGYLIMDDVQIHFVKEVCKMLKLSKYWEHVHTMGKSVFFKKISDKPEFQHWGNVEHIRRFTEKNSNSENPYAF